MAENRGGGRVVGEPTTDSPCVAVFDANYPSTLALVGSLARAGVRLQVFHPGRRCVLRYSRYVDRVRVCPRIDDHERFSLWLERQLEQGVFDLIAPTSDAMCYYIAMTLHRLPACYRERMPTRDALLDVLFKDRFAQACARLGIATPATYTPICLDEALADAQTIGYPLVLKPRSHICAVSARGGRIDNAQQLRAAFRAYRVAPGQQPLLAQHPQLGWPLLQAYVDHRQPQLSCSGLLDATGRVVASAATVKLDQSPSTTGTGTAFASHHSEDFLNTASGWIRRLLGRGLFEVEVLQRSSTDAGLVIDVNPRVFGQIGFDIARGNDLPALWLASLCGAVPHRPPPKRTAVCLYPAPFLLANATRVVTGPSRLQRLRRLVRLMAGARSFTGWSRRDPVASIVMSARPLRHPTTFIRSHIRERLHAGLMG